MQRLKAFNASRRRGPAFRQSEYQQIWRNLMESTATSTGTMTETITLLKKMVLDITQLKISPDQISDNANLFNDCGLDSTSVVDLVIAIEGEFGITIDEDELDVRLFQDLSCLSSFIETKQAAN
jgi:acyl carrier protein